MADGSEGWSFYFRLKNRNVKDLSDRPVVKNPGAQVGGVELKPGNRARNYISQNPQQNGSLFPELEHLLKAGGTFNHARPAPSSSPNTQMVGHNGLFL